MNKQRKVWLKLIELTRKYPVVKEIRRQHSSWSRLKVNELVKRYPSWTQMTIEGLVLDGWAKFWETANFEKHSHISVFRRHWTWQVSSVVNLHYRKSIEYKSGQLAKKDNKHIKKFFAVLPKEKLEQL